jgi:xanthine dehydrogenase YagT iron-sulfur-binding subunit
MIVNGAAVAAHVASAVALEQPADLPEAQPGSFFPTIGFSVNGEARSMITGSAARARVIVNGRRINSCLTLAVMHEGDSVTTIEGLGSPANLHPMQAAFIKHDGYQCGYCTPGQICSSVAMLKELEASVPSLVTDDLTTPATASLAEYRERMSGNICRCGAYSNIMEAISEVAGRKA